MERIENVGNYALAPIAPVEVEQALNRRRPGTPGRSAAYDLYTRRAWRAHGGTFQAYCRGSFERAPMNDSRRPYESHVDVPPLLSSEIVLSLTPEDTGSVGRSCPRRRSAPRVQKIEPRRASSSVRQPSAVSRTAALIAEPRRPILSLCVRSAVSPRTWLGLRRFFNNQWVFESCGADF